MTADVTIYDHVDLSEGVIIYTHKHYWNHSRKRRNDIEFLAPIPLMINEDVYVGRNAMLIGVSEIGKGAVIDAGSVLTKDVPSFEVWAGNPAKKVNERREGR